VNVLYCQVGGSLRRADQSSRGVLPSVVWEPVPRSSWTIEEKLSHIELYEHVHS